MEREDDPVLRVTSQLIEISERVGGIGDALRSAVDATKQHDEHVIAAQIARDQEQDRDRERLREAFTAAGREGDDGAGLATALAPYLEKLEDNLALLSAAREAAPETAQPTAAAAAVTGGDADFKYLASRQAEVIEVGLLPVLRSLNHNLTVSKAVWDRVSEISEALQRFRRPKKKPSATDDS